MKSLRKKNLAKPAFLLLALVLPWVFILFNFNYGILILNFVLLYVVAVSGLDIVFGYSGQISLGHAAYFAIGAYGSVLIHKYLGVPVIFSMLISSVLAALIGIVISYPASRLRFHFLSLATIAFGDVATGLFLILKVNLTKSRTGRALIAIRENPAAADGMGVNVTRYKVIGFAFSALYCGFAGGMYAHLVRFISPDTFVYKQSVMFLTMLLFGGTGNFWGPIIGVLSVTLLNEGLRSAERYQMFIYGFLMLFVIIALPGGIYGKAVELVHKKRRTSHADVH